MAMNPFPPQAYTRETLVKAYQWLQTQSPQLRELASTPDLLISLYTKAQLQGREALERPTLANFKSELRSLAGMMGEFDPEQAAAQNAAATAQAASASASASPSVSKSEIPMNTATPLSPMKAHSPSSNPQAPLQQPFLPIQEPLPNPPASVAAKPPPGHGMGAGATASNTQNMSAQTSKIESHVNGNTTSTRQIHSRMEVSQSTQVSSHPLMPYQQPPLPEPTSLYHVGLNAESLTQIQTIMKELNLGSMEEALRLALSVGYGRLSELFPPRRRN